MAYSYNNSFGYYNNMGAYPNNYPYSGYQPVYQPTVQQNQLPAQQTMIWVNNEREAEAYPVAPNNAVTLWDSSSPVVYLKKADASGRPTLTAYDLVERKAAEETTKAEETRNSQPAREYATKAEVRILREKLDKVLEGMKEHG